VLYRKYLVWYNEGMESLMEQTGFADQLRSIRKAADLTQTELSERSGIHRQVIARIELGENQPNWATVVVLARALGVTPNDFLPPAPPAAKPAKGKRPTK
jgi:transcriptional regulator with XRE-family HTH domain